LLESAIDRLPDRYRVVFVLRDVDGLDAAEAADCLGLTAEAVRTRLHRARAALRADLLERAGLVTASVFPLHLSRCDRVVAGVWAQLAAPPAAGLH
jgi:RNA polymerase sigma-70 factor (ECF subfamily)